VPEETLRYTNDPLRWVAADVRFPPVDQLATEIPGALRTRFKEQFPVLEPTTQLAISIGVAGQPGAAPQQVTLHRMLQRDRLMAITIGRDGMTLETTNYPGWPDFSKILSDLVDELASVACPDGVLRIGLRYVDEVRLPEAPATVRDWSHWIHPSLMGPLTLGSEEPSTANIALQFGEPPGYVTVFRAGPVPRGRSVNEDGPLRQPFPFPDGPYFWLDTDASWADPDRQVPVFTTDLILPVFEVLHTRTHELFEASITDELRAVLQKTREEVWSSK
jgi:uncharacterized protein (TIGR04255 family)